MVKKPIFHKKSFFSGAVQEPRGDKIKERRTLLGPCMFPRINAFQRDRGATIFPVALFNCRRDTTSGRQNFLWQTIWFLRMRIKRARLPVRMRTCKDILLLPIVYVSIITYYSCLLCMYWKFSKFMIWRAKYRSLFLRPSMANSLIPHIILSVVSSDEYISKNPVWLSMALETAYTSIRPCLCVR